MASVDILFDIAGEFETTDATELARVNRFLAYAASRMCASAFGTQYQLAACYLAAHMLRRAAETAAGSGGSGPLTSEKVRDTTWTFGAPSMAMTLGEYSLAGTPYGIEFMAIRESLALKPFIMDVTWGTMEVVW
uniref:Uncharacterized protein n=1 Tax=viral metagenome TaxID=1070528 RepID=A0A6M3KY06_9ZZZZ